MAFYGLLRPFTAFYTKTLAGVGEADRQELRGSWGGCSLRGQSRSGAQWRVGLRNEAPRRPELGASWAPAAASPRRAAPPPDGRVGVHRA